MINIVVEGTANYAVKQEEEKVEFDEMANLMSDVVDKIITGKRR